MPLIAGKVTPPSPAAGILSGTICANTPSSTSMARQPTMARAAQAAGGRGLTMVPSGRRISIARAKPSKFGISSLAMHFTMSWTADLTKGDGQLIAPGTSGDVPAQSTIMRSPSTVTVTLSGIGAGSSPSPSR